MHGLHDKYAPVFCRSEDSRSGASEFDFKRDGASTECIIQLCKMNTFVNITKRPTIHRPEDGPGDIEIMEDRQRHSFLHPYLHVQLLSHYFRIVLPPERI